MGARLVEMDRLLRDIQFELAPEREPAPVLVAADAPPSATAAETPAATVAPEGPPATAVPETPPGTTATATAPPASDGPQLQVLTELSARLLASVRELLAGYERMLVPSASPPPPSRRPARQRLDSPDVTLSAAPFESLEALREFEQAVSRLPGVREVAVRGYEGTDRAIIEVRLDQSNP